MKPSSFGGRSPGRLGARNFAGSNCPLRNVSRSPPTSPEVRDRPDTDMPIAAIPPTLVAGGAKATGLFRLA
jgi:hypothetical protein